MRKACAFSLVEVTVALGIAAFCLIAVLGLLPVGLNLNRESIEQAAAMNIAASLISDARSTPVGPTATNSSQFNLPLPATVNAGAGVTNQIALYLGEGGQKEALAANARYLALVTLTGPGTNRLDPIFMHVLISWPAQANAGVPTGAVTLNGANDARTTLQRPGGSVETTSALTAN